MSFEFDPQAFLDATTQEATSTETIPVPIGEYEATVADNGVDFKSGVSGPDSKNPGRPWLRLDVTWEIDDQRVKEAVSRDRVVVRQGIMLDLTEGNQIDMGKGKNVRYGRLRDALGLNEPGQPFSPRMMVGRRAKIKVSQRPYKDTIQNEVDAVTRLA